MKGINFIIFVCLLVQYGDTLSEEDLEKFKEEMTLQIKQQIFDQLYESNTIKSLTARVNRVTMTNQDLNSEVQEIKFFQKQLVNDFNETRGDLAELETTVGQLVEEKTTTAMNQICINIQTTPANFSQRYIMIVAGYISDTSSSTYATDNVEIVDLLSDTVSCGIRQRYNSYSNGGGYNYYYNTDGAILGGYPTVCGGYCTSSNCGSSRAGARSDCNYYKVTGSGNAQWQHLARRISEYLHK